MVVCYQYPLRTLRTLLTLHPHSSQHSVCLSPPRVALSHRYPQTDSHRDERWMMDDGRWMTVVSLIRVRSSEMNPSNDQTVRSVKWCSVQRAALTAFTDQSDSFPNPFTTSSPGKYRLHLLKRTSLFIHDAKCRPRIVRSWRQLVSAHLVVSLFFR